MPSFKTLWDNFPNTDGVKTRCFNKQLKAPPKPFEDYCAIMLSECFIKTGIRLDKCPGSKCWSHEAPRHVLLAQSLASWLARSPPKEFKAREVINATNFQKSLSGRTGVIFFKDYWRRGNESFAGRSGDHIDLWNSSRITGGSMTYRAMIEFLGLVSDLNKSKEIWFWEVK